MLRRLLLFARTCVSFSLIQELWIYLGLVDSFCLIFSFFLFVQRKAEAYREIWTDEGSPLLVETKKFCEGLQNKLGSSYKVLPAMRYGNPSLKDALEQTKDFTRIILFPMFPQYASSSTGSCLEYAFKSIAQQNNIPAVKVVDAYYKNPKFIGALIKSFHENIDFKDWDPPASQLSWSSPKADSKK